MKKFLLTIAIAAAVTLPSFAEIDMTSQLAATSFAADTTNVTPSSVAIGWAQDQVITFQCRLTATNAGAVDHFILSFDTSNNNIDWRTNLYRAELFGPGNGSAIYSWRLTNDYGLRWLRVGDVGNSNASSTVTISRMNYQAKD